MKPDEYGLLSKASAEFEFKDIPEQDLEELDRRAGEIVEAGLIRSYVIQIAYAHGVGVKSTMTPS